MVHHSIRGEESELRCADDCIDGILGIPPRVFSLEDRHEDVAEEGLAIRHIPIVVDAQDAVVGEPYGVIEGSPTMGIVHPEASVRGNPTMDDHSHLVLVELHPQPLVFLDERRIVHRPVCLDLAPFVPHKGEAVVVVIHAILDMLDRWEILAHLFNHYYTHSFSKNLFVVVKKVFLYPLGHCYRNSRGNHLGKSPPKVSSLHSPPS